MAAALGGTSSSLGAAGRWVLPLIMSLVVRLPAAADTLVLKSGDRIRGTVVSVGANSITFELELRHGAIRATQEVPLRDVKTIITREKLLRHLNLATTLKQLDALKSLLEAERFDELLPQLRSRYDRLLEKQIAGVTDRKALTELRKKLDDERHADSIPVVQARHDVLLRKEVASLSEPAALEALARSLRADGWMDSLAVVNARSDELLGERVATITDLAALDALRKQFADGKRQSALSVIRMRYDAVLQDRVGTVTELPELDALSRKLRDEGHENFLPIVLRRCEELVRRKADAALDLDAVLALKKEIEASSHADLVSIVTARMEPFLEERVANARSDEAILELIAKARQFDFKQTILRAGARLASRMARRAERATSGRPIVEDARRLFSLDLADAARALLHLAWRLEPGLLTSLEKDAKQPWSQFWNEEAVEYRVAQAPTVAACMELVRWVDANHLSTKLVTRCHQRAIAIDPKHKDSAAYKADLARLRPAMRVCHVDAGGMVGTIALDGMSAWFDIRYSSELGLAVAGVRSVCGEVFTLDRAGSFSTVVVKTVDTKAAGAPHFELDSAGITKAVAAAGFDLHIVSYQKTDEHTKYKRSWSDPDPPLVLDIAFVYEIHRNRAKLREFSCSATHSEPSGYQDQIKAEQAASRKRTIAELTSKHTALMKSLKVLLKTLADERK